MRKVLGFKPKFLGHLNQYENQSLLDFLEVDKC